MKKQVMIAGTDFQRDTALADIAGNLQQLVKGGVRRVGKKSIVGANANDYARLGFTKSLGQNIMTRDHGLHVILVIGVTATWLGYRAVPNPVLEVRGLARSRIPVVNVMEVAKGRSYVESALLSAGYQFDGRAFVAPAAAVKAADCSALSVVLKSSTTKVETLLQLEAA